MIIKYCFSQVKSRMNFKIPLGYWFENDSKIVRKQVVSHTKFILPYSIIT